MNRNKEGNMLILDIEGTDSKERGDQRVVSILFTRLIFSHIAISYLIIGPLFG